MTCQPVARAKPLAVPAGRAVERVVGRAHLHRVNAALDRLSQAVLEHGGTIDQFVGDAVVAFWGAPIARPDDGERATRAAIAMWRVGEAFRKTPTEGHPALGRTLPRTTGHLAEWVNACGGGPATFSDFATGGQLTEIVLAGVVALRLQTALDWDGAAMRANGAPEADQFIQAHYRRDWKA